MIIELSSCDIVCEVNHYIEKGELSCSYRDGSFHQGIPDELVINDIKIIEVHFDNSFIGKRWLRDHPGWVAWLVGIVEEEITDYDSVYYKQLMEK